MGFTYVPGEGAERGRVPWLGSGHIRVPFARLARLHDCLLMSGAGGSLCTSPSPLAVGLELGWTFPVFFRLEPNPPSTTN